MQDDAAFFRQPAQAAFYRRRKYPVNSEEWLHCVEEAQRFIGYYRSLLKEGRLPLPWNKRQRKARLFMMHPDESPDLIGVLPYLIHPPAVW